MTLVCFSHLRWDFVFQRPQHLMTLLSQQRHVLFWEEPVDDDGQPWLELRAESETLTVAVPHLDPGLSIEDRNAALRSLLDGQLAKARCPLIRWYYTPMMLGFSRHLDAACTVYDCMDELANFRFAPVETQRKAPPVARADRSQSGVNFTKEVRDATDCIEASEAKEPGAVD